jgi:hypothetical protein
VLKANKLAYFCTVEGCVTGATILTITTLSIMPFSIIVNKTRTRFSIMTFSTMAAHCYAEYHADCHLCRVSHISPLWWVTLWWMTLCWVSLCWGSLCWVSLCWVSKRHVPTWFMKLTAECLQHLEQKHSGHCWKDVKRNSLIFWCFSFVVTIITMNYVYFI